LSFGDDLVDLRRGSASVVVDPRAGGRLTSLVVGGREILGRSVDPAVPAAMRAGSFAMVPFAGRLPGGRLAFDDRTWQIPVNLGDAAAHGVCFDVPWTVDRVDGRSVALSVRLDARWPFGGRATQEVRLLDDAVEVTVTVANEERSMPAALGLHPWFARRHEGVDASVHLEPPAGAPPRPWDTCFTDLARPPTAGWPGQRLVVESATRTWTVYEQDPDAFCIEPLTHPMGGVATGDAAVVCPGRPLTLVARIRLLSGSGV
jgi:aldose 1-epimerase